MADAVVNDVPPPPPPRGFTQADLDAAKAAGVTEGGTNMTAKASAIVDAHATAGNTAEDGLKVTIGKL